MFVVFTFRPHISYAYIAGRAGLTHRARSRQELGDWFLGFAHRVREVMG
jgi:hypothetical protein